jgi:hypothetical protein
MSLKAGRSDPVRVASASPGGRWMEAKTMVKRTRMQAKRRKAAGERVRVRASEQAAERAVRERGPAVPSQARRLLAECCAFFKADRYREAAPGTIRRHDVEVAEAQIDAIIRKFCST